MADKRVRYIIEFDTKSGEGQIKNLDGQIIKTANSAKQLSNEIKNLASGADGKGGMQGLTTATGGASAAALELGRVISDAPYGIRGMANNVSQLASNILFMSQQTNKATGATIGFMGAVGNMFKALKGPLGVLLAIQAVVAALDFFAGSTKKAEKATKSFNAIAGEAASNLKLLRIAINENLISQENLQKAINSANKEYEDLNLKTSENTALEIASKEALDDKIKSLEDLAKAQAILKAIEEDLGKLAELSLQSAELEEEANKAELAAINAISNSYRENGTAALESAAATKRAAADANKNAIDALRENIKKSVGLIEKENLWDELFTGGNKEKRAKRIKDFKVGLLDLTSELEKFANIQLKNSSLSEEQRLALEYEASKRAIENKRLEYKDKEDARLDARLKEINDLKITEDEKAKLVTDAYNKYNAAQVQANEDMREVMLQADIAYYSQLRKLREEESNEYRRSLDSAEEEYLSFIYTQDVLAQTNIFDRIDAEKKANDALTKLKIDNLKEELKVKGLTAAQIQNINNQVSKLENDQVLYNQELEAKSAQAKMDVANQLADGIIAIAGEGSGVAKGVAIAQTTWNTSQAVMAALGAAPYGPWNIAQAVAVGLMGAAEIKNILATKAPHEKPAASTGGSAGRGATTFMPDFNIVGASGQNQLAATVAGQVGEPVRAYVVYDDLSTAGEIEANAVTAAGI